jgi:adenylyltransferase/sulfurtransferase
MDKRRYSRNIMLDGIGVEGQQKLLDARVLVVGAGALGSVASLYLAASGVGHIAVADFDTVDISNLQRQLTFTEADLGRPKAQVTAEKLRALNSEVEVEAVNELLRPEAMRRLAPRFDLVIEGSDNPETKYMVTDLCAEIGKPCVLGGVAQYAGQVVSCMPGAATYRDFFAEPAAAGGFTPCAMGGVLGPLPGIIGSVMAAEAVKIITGAGRPLASRLLLVDALTMQFTELRID